ncbi:MAG: IS66 family transposase [Chloroflexota bacterium]|nr:IS66 family transposase [Chloroflexota bacterium]
MTAEEELIQLRQENRLLQEQASLHQETMSLQQELIKRQQEQITLLERELSLQQQHMTQLIEQVKVLHERLSKDSHNSHLPPSSDRFGRKPKSLRTKSEKKSGGQPGHPGASLRWSCSPDEVVEQHVEQCEVCQHNLHTVAACHVERRQVVDVPAPRLIVREYGAEQKQCPVCQHITAAPFPPEAAAPIQYGPTLAATAVYLTQQQLLPLARACEVLYDLLGVQMSEGTLCELTQKCAAQLVQVEQQIKAALIQAQVIHQDETGLRVAGKRHWMHVTCTASLTHYQVHSSRGQAALEAIGILPAFTGISIHDGWASYFLYPCVHACCNVHLLRELIFLAQEQGCQWATDLKSLLLDMKEATQQAREQGKHWLDPLEVADWEGQFLHILDEGDLAHPRATAPPGTRGRSKQSPARNLLDRLRKYQPAFLCFLEDLRVDFDNNQAERDVRMVKLQQKISGCFRTVLGAQAFSRIRGYLSTLRKQDIPLLSALQATFCGHPVLPSL